MHDVVRGDPMAEPDPPADWPELRFRLWRGLRVHLAIFVSSILMLFAINWLTRGADGSWWIVAVLQVWVIAWALHLAGVGRIYATKRTDR